MIVTTRYLSYFKPLALATALAATSSVYGAETAQVDAVQNPWAFNLTAYLWMPGVNADFSAGSLNKSVDASFIDIVSKLRNFPMAFNGHFEASYEKVGFYLDGNYMGMDFKPRFDQISQGLSLRMGVMEYGAMYRLFGESASERTANWDKKSTSNSLDIYAGGRTLWIGTQAQLNAPLNTTLSSNMSVTAPLIGGRITVELTPKWFVLMDGNAGGFGVDNITFTGSALGTVGYRTRLFGVPASVEGGYKALRIDLSKGIAATNVTLNGPYLGLTGYW